jgi:hypothetical protein
MELRRVLSEGGNQIPCSDKARRMPSVRRLHLPAHVLLRSKGATLRGQQPPRRGTDSGRPPSIVASHQQFAASSGADCSVNCVAVGASKLMS